MTRIVTHLPADGSVRVIPQTDEQGRCCGVLRVAIIGWLVVSTPLSGSDDPGEGDTLDYPNGWYTAAQPIFGGVHPDCLQEDNDPWGTARDGTVLMDDEAIVKDEPDELIAYFELRLAEKAKA